MFKQERHVSCPWTSPRTYRKLLKIHEEQLAKARAEIPRRRLNGYLAQRVPGHFLASSFRI